MIAHARPDALLLVPHYLVFGSEELSMQAPAVAERAGHAAVRIAPEDAKRLKLDRSAEVGVRTRAGTCRLPVRIDASVPPGTAAVPVGWPGLPWLDPPGWGELEAAAVEAEAT